MTFLLRVVLTTNKFYTIINVLFSKKILDKQHLLNNHANDLFRREY